MAARASSAAGKSTARRAVAKSAAPPKSWKASLLGTLDRLFARTPGNPHHAFRLTRPRRLRMSSTELKAIWRLLLESWQFVIRHKRILLGLGALYAVLTYVLVGGISQVDFVSLKNATTQVVDGNVGALGTAFSLYGAALTGNLTSPPSDVQSFLSATLLIFFWLSLVWATRMLIADKEIRLRDALYNSGTPIVPTLVIMAVAVVQLIPAALGIFAYATALNGGWLTGGVEAMVFALAAAMLCLLSAYLAVSSMTALVVVTFPGVYPWQALREARALVMSRRWNVALRLLVLAIFILVAWGIVLIPTFLLDGWLQFNWLPLVPVVVQVLLGLTLVYTSVFIYKVYRSLL